MAELILEHSTHVKPPRGPLFIARTYGEERSDGTWAGWLEFIPLDGAAPVLRTDRETSQPNRQALEYWASGLEPVYFEGAFERAQIKTGASAKAGSRGRRSSQYATSSRAARSIFSSLGR